MDRTPRHAVRPGIGRARRAGAVIGGLAVIAAVAIGVFTLSRPTVPATATTSALRTAREITPTAVEPIPLSVQEMVGLLNAPADLGPLTDPQRRASCLTGLGYPASTSVLGARQVQMNGRGAVVLVLADQEPQMLAVVAVPTGCSAANTGLLADTSVPRP